MSATRHVPRDVERGIQDAGLRIEETIRLVYSTPDPEVTAAIDTHAAYIAAETLSTDMFEGDPAGEAFTADVKAGKIAVTIWLSRARSLVEVWQAKQWRDSAGPAKQVGIMN